MFETNNRILTRSDIDAATLDQGLRAHMLRVYNYMASAVALSGIVAALVASSPAAIQLIFGTPLKWAFMLAPLAFIMVMSFRFESMSKTAMQALFWAYAACIGVSFAAFLLVFTGASVARAFFISAAMFAGMSLYGYTTKADLTKFSTFLIMGVFGLLIASVVNIFVGSTALQFAISAITVLVFCGLTAWDTQRIKDTYAEYAGTEIEGKLTVMNALGLYINFVAIFQAILHLTGQRNDE
ncbi:MAG: Bax inhibitor-1/YccA family protein [Alphaproteobacteria bacterium]|nr:Bax inhibitor-1/YccA family protein [Alphaproteobacteria bacterium]MBN9495925.1 Bax inhibitor-1/YccA family protein [Alphaproteobacteria bacterium]